MAWTYLLLAGFFEVIWAFAMKKSEGFTLITPTIITIVMMLVSFSLLSIAMKSLPLGTAYTVWTGIGAVGAFIFGVVFLNEALTPTRIFAAILIILGIILMKLASTD